MVDTTNTQSRDKPKTQPALQTDPASIVESAVLAQTHKQQQQQQQRHVWRGRDVVFVDPLDSSVPYWWPAMIVPTDEIDATMGCTHLGHEEYLVKYFEDCKYSTVRGKELRLFDTNQLPFTEFAANSPGFAKDKPIKSALSYLKTGHVHSKFQWKLWQTGSETLHLPFDLPAEILDKKSPISDGSTLVSPAIPISSTSNNAEEIVDSNNEHNSAAEAAADNDNNSPISSNGSANDQANKPDITPQQEQHNGTTATPRVENTADDQLRRDSTEAPDSTPMESSVPPSDSHSVSSLATSPAPSQQQPVRGTQTRSRRGRQPKPTTTNTTNTATTTSNGAATGKRGRPSTKYPKHKSTNLQSEPSISTTTTTTESLSASLAADDDASIAVISDIRHLVKELEDIQDEYKVFQSLVKRAAKDLWSELGNDWPPNSSGTSTRFGKRRKLN